MKHILQYAFAWAAIGIGCNAMQAQHLTIVTANDTHSMVQPDADGLGGFVRQKAIVDSLRQTNENVLAVHAGDAVQGTVYFSTFRGEVEYAMLDSIGFDIIIMGNHEFDNGIHDIAKYYGNMRANKVCSNYDLTGTPCQGIFQPYVIKHVGDKRVAFIGINLNPKGMIADKNTSNLTYHDATTVALKLSEYLKTSGLADRVVMVSHIGYNYTDTSESDVAIARKSRYIDLIIGGHSHTLIDPNGDKHLVANADGRIIPIVQAGKYGKNMCQIDIDLATGNTDYRLISVDATRDAWANRFTALKQWLKPFDDEVHRVMTLRIATSARAMSNSELTYLPNFVCDAVTEIIAERWGKVDFAIMNRGGIRQPLPKGDIAEGMITSMLPFDNKLVVLRIKGSDLINALEVMTRRRGDAVSRQLDIKFRDHSIVWAKLNGKPIDADKYYTMVTVDYLANGGDYMEPFTKAERLFTDTVPYGNLVLEYVKQLGEKGVVINPDGKVRMHN